MPSSPPNPTTVRAAQHGDLSAVLAMMAPPVARGELLPRKVGELAELVQHAFVAEADGRVVGFAALEIYSTKMSEIQCLAFDSTARGHAIAGQVVRPCVERARQQGVLEVLAVVPAALEPTMKACGFDFSLPGQKRAMFVRPTVANHAFIFPDGATEDPGVSVRSTTPDDLPAVVQFTDPFVAAQGYLLPRSATELADLLRDAFLAEVQGRVVGFAALDIYSGKLSEIQCLSVDEAYRGRGLGRRLVAHCVERARQHGVAEIMAISLRDDFFVRCGFDYSVSGPEIAMFLRTR